MELPFFEATQKWYCAEQHLFGLTPSPIRWFGAVSCAMCLHHRFAD